MNLKPWLNAAGVVARLAKNASPDEKLLAKAAARTEKELSTLVASAKGWSAKERAVLTDPRRLEAMRQVIFRRQVSELRTSAKRPHEQARLKRREAILAAFEARQAMKGPPATTAATTKTSKPK